MYNSKIRATHYSYSTVYTIYTNSSGIFRYFTQPNFNAISGIVDSFNGTREGDFN